MITDTLSGTNAPDNGKSIPDRYPIPKGSSDSSTTTTYSTKLVERQKLTFYGYVGPIRT